MRVLQLGEDGELLEVSRRLGRDVDGSERRGQLPGRRQRAVSLRCVPPREGSCKLPKCRIVIKHSTLARKKDRTPKPSKGQTDRWQP